MPVYHEFHVCCAEQTQDFSTAFVAGSAPTPLNALRGNLLDEQPLGTDFVFKLVVINDEIGWILSFHHTDSVPFFKATLAFKNHLHVPEERQMCTSQRTFTLTLPVCPQ